MIPPRGAVAEIETGAAPDEAGSARSNRLRRAAACHLGAWAVGLVFAVFAVRSFCWLVYVDGNHLKIQSPNNLGDLALHITYIKYFANGVALWPDNPIHVFSSCVIPPGSISSIRSFSCSISTWSARSSGRAARFARDLLRFLPLGRRFGVAGFLFNGGLAGFEFFKKFHFADYQAEKIAWKSIPLAMFVTQRGLLYAIPAGLLLLLHWRRKYYPESGDEAAGARRGLLPWWVEWSLYATMPFFHVHTFLALSIVLAFWLLIGTWEMRKQIALLLAAAFVPATWIVWMITDHFQAKSILAWAPGWVQSDPGFAVPALQLWFVKIPSALGFWIYNFGLMLPRCSRSSRSFGGLEELKDPASPGRSAPDRTDRGSQRWQSEHERTRSGSQDLFYFQRLRLCHSRGRNFFPRAYCEDGAVGLGQHQIVHLGLFHLSSLLVERIDREMAWPSAIACFLLFASGFVSLLGGLAGAAGFDLADRTELEAVATAVHKLPIKDRFAAFPTYNHPLLVNGRKVVLGYPGHLWTQGFDYGRSSNNSRPSCSARPTGGNGRGPCIRAISFGAGRKSAPMPQVRSRGAGRRRSSRKVSGAQFTTSKAPRFGAPITAGAVSGLLAERSRINCCSDAFCPTKSATSRGLIIASSGRKRAASRPDGRA